MSSRSFPHELDGEDFEYSNENDAYYLKNDVVKDYSSYVIGDYVCGKIVYLDGAGKLVRGYSYLTWLTIKTSCTDFTIHVRNFVVSGFLTAVSAINDRELSINKTGKIYVENNRFENIGGVDKVSTAVVRFVNYSDFLISNNLFLHVRNKNDCALLHSIYLAHGSKRGKVIGNFFHDTCGDVIRLRDASDDNIIVDNVFSDISAKALISTWRCRREKYSCTKVGIELPSVRTVIGSNLNMSNALPWKSDDD